MLRKMMIALFASASVAMLAPDAALARGGFGGGGGGFHGGGGGFGGGFHGGGFRGGGMGMGGGASGLPQSAAAVSVRPRSAAVVSVRPLCRLPDFAAARLPSTVSTAASTTVSGTGDFRLPWRQSD